MEFTQAVMEQRLEAGGDRLPGRRDADAGGIHGRYPRGRRAVLPGRPSVPCAPSTTSPGSTASPTAAAQAGRTGRAACRGRSMKAKALLRERGLVGPPMANWPVIWTAARAGRGAHRLSRRAQGAGSRHRAQERSRRRQAEHADRTRGGAGVMALGEIETSLEKPRLRASRIRRPCVRRWHRASTSNWSFRRGRIRPWRVGGDRRARRLS